MKYVHHKKICKRLYRVHTTRHSTSLIIKEEQCKTTILHLYTFTKIVILKITDSIKCWQTWGATETLISAYGGETDKNCFGNQVGSIYSSCIYVKPGPQQIHNRNEYICKPKDMYYNFYHIILKSSLKMERM